MTTRELLDGISAEDRTVADAVAEAIPQLERLVDATHARLAAGGRLFYLGAGTSGRLGVVDASECPPTFGVPHGLVVGLIAGGDGAIRRAVEFAEDDRDGGWRDLRAHDCGPEDVVVGIAASGTTPYVLGGVADARAEGCATGCVTCFPGSPLARAAEWPVEIDTGPEFVTGSTRMKAGTAQKLALNMLTTSVMVKLGRVRDNRMVDMALSNDKLWERGVRMLRESDPSLSVADARARLERYGSVRAALDAAAE